jgi:hypothetical protein
MIHESGNRFAMRASKDADRAYNTAYVRMRRARHRQIGLCIRCTEPVKEGRALCAKHLAYVAEYVRKARKKRRKKR